MRACPGINMAVTNVENQLRKVMQRVCLIETKSISVESTHMYPVNFCSNKMALINLSVQYVPGILKVI